MSADTLADKRETPRKANIGAGLDRLRLRQKMSEDGPLWPVLLFRPVP